MWYVSQYGSITAREIIRIDLILVFIPFGTGHQDESAHIHTKGEEKKGGKQLEDFCKDVSRLEEIVEKNDSPTPVSKETDNLSRASEILPIPPDSMNVASTTPSIHPNMQWTEMGGVKSRNTSSDDAVLKPDVLLCSQPQQGILHLGLNTRNESPMHPSFQYVVASYFFFLEVVRDHLKIPFEDFLNYFAYKSGMYLFQFA